MQNNISSVNVAAIDTLPVNVWKLVHLGAASQPAGGSAGAKPELGCERHN